ncbi:hypothetical protein CapIbe_014440 [Capra ibex]
MIQVAQLEARGNISVIPECSSEEEGQHTTGLINPSQEPLANKDGRLPRQQEKPPEGSGIMRPEMEEATLLSPTPSTDQGRFADKFNLL